ncbi:MAG TPA: TetR/AcrR family transcriptional regulator [Streptosporangiaceae bacterium]
MPRVSEAHLERRRRQILDAARVCFIRKGFYETSMQDVFRESGLSAGAVYRYFKSKDELVKAIATEGEELLAGFMEDILRQDPLPPLDQIAGRFADFALTLTGPDGILRIAPHAWAAAMHNPEIATAIQELVRTIRRWLFKIVERLRDEGRLAPDVDVEAVGTTLSFAMPGFVLSRLLLEDVDADTFRNGIAGLLAAPAGTGAQTPAGTRVT